MNALAMDPDDLYRERRGVEPSLAIGAVAGGLTVLGFTILHGLIISDILDKGGRPHSRPPAGFSSASSARIA